MKNLAPFRPPTGVIIPRWKASLPQEISTLLLALLKPSLPPAIVRSYISMMSVGEDYHLALPGQDTSLASSVSDRLYMLVQRATDYKQV